MKAKDKLRAYYSKRESDVMLYHPFGYGTRADAHWLGGIFDKTFTHELEARGYDPTTMRFSVEPKTGHDKFHSQRNQTRGTKNAQA